MVIGKEDESWVMKIEVERATALCPSAEVELWEKASIYRVPSIFRDLNAKAFTPQVVSFGPYHHGSGHLKPMEEHKHRALLHFLNRAGRPLQDFMVDVGSVLQQLQGSYSDLDDEWKRDGGEKFLKLMIVDGCFMLEILRCYARPRRSSSSSAGIESRSSSSSSSSIGGEEDGYAHNDPLFSKHGVLHRMPYIRRDMLMLENQLPLLLLNTLHSVVLQRNGPDDHEVKDAVKQLVLVFMAPEDKDARSHASGLQGLGLHALDLFRQNMLRGPQPPPPLKQPRASRIRSAVELHDAGVGFRRSNGTSNSLRNIRFEGGVLTLPTVAVDDATECTFLNLVAYEHLHVGVGNDVTSYVSFMDELIDTDQDVAMLHSRGIIENGLGNDEAVAALFNGLSKEVTLDPRSRLGGVRQGVNSHCRKQCNTWRANLKHTYFRNPWSLLSLAAAILLLALTVAQTVYTVITYYHD